MSAATSSPSTLESLLNTNALSALTMQAPWASLMLLPQEQGPKLVENRGWAAPSAYVGGLLALHQGKAYDRAGAEGVAKEFGIGVSAKKDCPLGAVVGVARLRACVRSSSSRWAVPGAFHWCLEGVVALPRPVPCSGALGLWKLPGEVLRQVKEQLLGEREGRILAPSGESAREVHLPQVQPVVYRAQASTRAQAVKCLKCGGMYLDYGPGPHAPRYASGAPDSWPKCTHGTWYLADCVGEPCPPACCREATP